MPNRDPKLSSINEKIAALVAVEPCANIYIVFFSAARLAAEAVKAAEEHQQFAGAANCLEAPHG